MIGISFIVGYKSSRDSKTNSFAFTEYAHCETGYQCDPHRAGHISKSDQLLPYYVMDRLQRIYARHYGRIRGGHLWRSIEVSCVQYCYDSRSTLSDGLNAFSAVVFVSYCATVGHDKIAVVRGDGSVRTQ
ncbi:unnamed protein product [Sphagnum balticum]